MTSRKILIENYNKKTNLENKIQIQMKLFKKKTFFLFYIFSYIYINERANIRHAQKKYKYNTI